MKDYRVPVIKSAIVMSSTLGKYNRWDAPFFMGEDLSAGIVMAEKGLADAMALLERRKTEQSESMRVHWGMVARKEVIPFEQ